MDFLLDADGLIKLQRAGLLALVLESFPCMTTEAVYSEVVTAGKAFQHEDAHEIEQALVGRIQVLSDPGDNVPIPSLGAGESSILAVLPVHDDAIVISDDRRFLTVLSARGERFLTPVDMLLLLARRSKMSLMAAVDALQALRPAIRANAYWETRAGLDAMKRGEL